MENKEVLTQNNLLDKVLKFYSDNKIDVLQVQLKDVEINIKKEQINSVPETLDIHIEQEDYSVENSKAANIVTINSPMVGVFYNSPNQGSPIYVKEGDYIKSGKVVGLIEAMKTFNEIRTEVEGIVKEIMVVDGQMVEHGQALLKVVLQ